MPIIPDTKDWTWVIDEPCPECGLDTRSLPRERVADMLRESSKAWRDVLARTSTVRRRPTEDVWSALEYACHVRDVCRLFAERLRLMLTEEAPLYPNWDQDETAVAERYAEQEPAVVSDELAGAADVLAGLFDGVTGEEWERVGRRSDGAVFTVDTFARYLLHDVIHHLHDVGASPIR